MNQFVKAVVFPPSPLFPALALRGGQNLTTGPFVPVFVLFFHVEIQSYKLGGPLLVMNGAVYALFFNGLIFMVTSESQRTKQLLPKGIWMVFSGPLVRYKHCFPEVAKQDLGNNVPGIESGWFSMSGNLGVLLATHPDL